MLIGRFGLFMEGNLDYEKINEIGEMGTRNILESKPRIGRGIMHFGLVFEYVFRRRKEKAWNGKAKGRQGREGASI